MAAKVTMVKLAVPVHGLERLFSVEHAERLLAMLDNGGWVLADEKYQYKDGTISKRDKKSSKRGKE